MKKTICCIGSRGFIGNQIYEQLKNSETYEIFRYSSEKNQFIDQCNLEKFDYLIFSAGVHNESQNDDKNIFYQTKKIFKDTRKIFINSNSIIYISSFKTCFNTNKKIIKSTNKYNFYKFDNNYGKSKIIFEKLFIKFCLNFKKEYMIVCPSHVIGPNDIKYSANGKFFDNILKKRIIIFPNCNISVIDVRNLAQIVKNIILKKKFHNSKIIANDLSLPLEDYIKHIKANKKNYIQIKVNLFFIRLLFILNKFLIKIKFTKKDIISKTRLEYIKMNPQTEITNLKKDFSFDKTIFDTRNFFLKK